MGSDRGTFMEAAGDAIGQSLQDYKFDKKEDEEKFIKQAELMVDFEWKKRENTLAAMNLQSQVHGIKVSDALQDLANRREKATAEASIDDKMYTSGIQNLATQNQLLRDMQGYKRDEAKDQLTIANLRQQGKMDMAGLMLDEKKMENDFFIQQVNQLTAAQKNYNYAMNFPEDRRDAFTKFAVTAKTNNIKPQDFAKAMVLVNRDL